MGKTMRDTIPPHAREEPKSPKKGNIRKPSMRLTGNIPRPDLLIQPMKQETEIEYLAPLENP